MNTPQEATSEDPAASLRAAALRTLKSKRRKLNSAQAPDIPSTLPTRPIVVPTPSIQLDYGQAEPAEASPVPPSATTSLTKEDVSRMDVDEDSLAREEGEISDSETAPETPSKRNTTSAMEVTQPSRLPPPTLTPPTSISVKTESLPVIIPEVHSAAVRPTPERFLAFDPDMGYVRPGLQMTQANYDTAKDIILDLLGWGVPPEYLVRCGLSREIVYYAFLDFNLRLPADFDVTGLPTVDELAAMASAVLGRRTTSRSATPIRPHPTSPPPSSADVTTQPTSLSAIAPPFVPPATANGTDTNLSELEQQRRNMLLARKAAQKSRKPKEPLAHEAPRPLQVPAGIIPQHNGVHSLSSVPPMAVDDFLNSIEPTRDNSREGSKAPVSRTNTADDMDVDEPSGLITRSFSVPDSGEGSSAASPGPSKLTEQTPTPLQRSDTDKIFASGAGSRSSSSSATPPIAVPKVPTLPVRRGTKRPVAADFVDMEPVSSRSTNGQSTLQHHHHHHGASRKKPGGFAVVSSKPRRMVIDLTDSEDDSGDDDDVSRPRQRGGSVQAKATVLSTAPSELEREILNLKAQIARRELEAKLKKQRDIALASGSGTPLASEEPPIVKQEEDDEMTVSVALQGVDDRTTTEPPDSGAPSLPESTAHSPPMTPDTPIGPRSLYLRACSQVLTCVS
ncbi:hypothetical protein BXZ70DRAFT_1005295 [Cristinia sonorae]|uniref:Uncharacterized protein n=1 Tax=Cristinia sonorae TaxID=1940300 RepID=A0A8K0XSZ6_9AGAR|nr:hypothetical protein BXZ70DRAFT_1005295 [Cristinia sonorae]